VISNTPLLDTFTFPSTTAGLSEREHLAANLLACGRSVRLFRETRGLFELLMLEAGQRQGLLSALDVV
jgi:hypothetical protein